MAQVKLPPRQRMINMMYIVLIAMLALNVDKHVLKAFHLMEKNFVSSAESYDQKNNLQMAHFLQLVEKEEDKATPYFEAAKEAQVVSKEFDEYIATLKTEIVELYNGRLDEEEGEEGLTSLKTPEGMEKHAHLFMVKNQGKKAKELQNKINQTSTKLLSLLKPDKRELFVNSDKHALASQANLLKAEEPKNIGISQKSWASINLEYQPAGAVVALLTQYQNNAKALEADVIAKLMGGINQSAHIIDGLNAAIIPKSNYVMEGENYEADVMLIASSSSAIPKITANGSAVTDVDGNVGKIIFRANGVGEKTVKGQIEVANPKTGEPEFYAYQHTYQVFKPVATVSPDALNLIYRSLDNPVSISVPGFSAADIRVTADNGASITGRNGKYNIKMTGSARKINISVFAKGQKMGTTEFRVRNIPEPSPMLGGIRNDSRAKSKADICAQDVVLATLGEDFAYDLPFRVTSFRFIYAPRRGNAVRMPTSGNRLTPAMKRLTCNANQGDQFIIESIKAKDVKYGIIRNVPPMTITIR